MDKSGLSKGAIFHYVKSKDEIFAWVLQERLEETNERFTNKVLMYLLGKEDQPAVAQALNQFYEQSVHFAKLWIVTGQQHAVISAAVDAGQTAELFVLFSRPDWLVTATGWLEIAGAVGILLPATSRVASTCLALMLIAMFPANLRAAREGLTIRGRATPKLLVRTLLQLVFLAAVILAG